MTSGWLEHAAVEWPVLPAKSVFTERRESSNREDIHLTPSQIHGVLPQSDYMQLTGTQVVQNLAGQDSMKHVEPDDFIIHLRSFQGGIEHSRHRGKVSTAYTVLTPRGDAEPRFFRWLLKSDGYIQELRTTVNQLRDGQSIKYRDFAKVALPLPPLAEQRAIADYLDRETAQIDTLIEEQLRLLTLLEERRVALIDSSFSAQAPNSTVQRCSIDVIDCPHTSPQVDPAGTFEAVRTSSVRDGTYRPGFGLPVSESTWFSRNSAGTPEPGDVLFTREAPAGEACVVDAENLCLGQRMVLLKLDGGICLGEFLTWQLYSERVQTYFRSQANGSTVTNIRLPVLRATPIWLPPVATQRLIVRNLSFDLARMQRLRLEIETSVDLARERRAALITAAVTGQIDVGGA